MELSSEQKTFVAAVVVIAIIVAVGTLIFACVWCLLDQDGLCPPGWCSWLGTPKDTFSPQRWWMEALAQRVENLEAGQPLMERKGRRTKVSVAVAVVASHSSIPYFYLHFPSSQTQRYAVSSQMPSFGCMLRCHTTDVRTAVLCARTCRMRTLDCVNMAPPNSETVSYVKEVTRLL